MSGPWEDYQSEEGEGPWTDYTDGSPAAPGRTSFGELAQQVVPDALKAVSRTMNPIELGRDASTVLAAPEAQRRIAPWLPAVGGVIGSGFGPAGIAAGAGVGAIAENAVKVGLDDPAAPRTSLDAAKYAMAQTALGGVGEANAALKAVPGAASYGARATSFVTDKLGNAAIGAGRRALGFSKRFLGKPGQLEKANEVAGTMLEEGVIRPFSGAAGMTERAEDLAEASGQAIGRTLSGLDEAGARSLNPSDVIRDIQTQLSPKYTGGAYDAQKRILNEIVETVRAHGDKPLTFESAQVLKNTLQDLGKFQAGGDSVRQDMYRRASGIIREALDRSVAQQPGSPALAAEYARNKKRFGHSQEALRALANRTSSEAGNRLVSGTDIVTGAGAAATGQIPANELPGKLGLLLAAKRGVERYGASTAAVTYRRAADLIKNNAFGVNTARRAVISRIITNQGEERRD